MHGKSKQSKEISFCFVSFSKISKIHIAQHLSNYMHRMIILTNFSTMHMKHTCTYAVVGKKFEINKKEKSFAFSYKTLLSTT